MAKKRTNILCFLIYLRTTDFGTIKESSKYGRLHQVSVLGKENMYFLYLIIMTIII